MDKKTQQELILIREELRELMEQVTRQAFNRVAGDRYKWGNKSGKYRAKTLKNKNFKFKMKKGEVVHLTTEIAQAFQSYYSALYAVQEKGSQEAEISVNRCRKSV